VGFLISALVDFPYWKISAKNVPHLGQSLSFGKGFTILYPQFSHLILSSLGLKKGFGIQNQLEKIFNMIWIIKPNK